MSVGVRVSMCVIVVVVVVEIIKLYLVQTGRFLAITDYVTPSPNHAQIIFQIRVCLNVATRQKGRAHNNKPPRKASPLAQNS